MARGTAKKANRAAYQWDVFISYARNPIASEWVEKSFVPQLRSRISTEIGIRDPRVFLDVRDIRTSHDWESRLGIALRSSICMVAILTADYWRSRWCRTEWKAFVRRESELTKRFSKTAGGLIFPVQLADGENRNVLAAKKQTFDLRNLALVGPAFEQSQAYLDLQLKVRDFAGKPELRALLKSPPPPGRMSVHKERKDQPVPSSMSAPGFV